MEKCCTLMVADVLRPLSAVDLSFLRRLAKVHMLANEQSAEASCVGSPVTGTINRRIRWEPPAG